MLDTITRWKTLPAYDMIQQYYKDTIAKRSNVPYMNHIDEGLLIFSYLQQKYECINDNTISAYCLHPIFQSDIALSSINYKDVDNVDSVIIMLTMEYRNIANAYLSNRIINYIDEIKLSPLDEVNVMILVDKIQNRKDFELYHKGKHDRSNELDIYFKNWLNRLCFSEKEYEKVIKYISNNLK